jgi:molybdopterin molybdotransferase
MIPFEEAQKILDNISISLATERVELLSSLQRVLAEDVFSDTDVPAFNKSAMDGFACRKADLGNILDEIEEIPAGTVPTKTIAKNQCSRIMTGGMIPDGADTVIQLEHASIVKPGFIKRTFESASSNICIAGEDIKKGDIVLVKGEKILPQHIAILATAGAGNPLVYSIPSMAVFSTGSELVEPEQKPGISQVRNSNGWQIMAQAAQLGYKPEYLGIVPDDKTLLQKSLANALNKFQIILISGGVSVGDYDYVPVVLKQLGVEILFHGIDAKPGKHILFGKKNNCLVFGLPGNPVSSFIQFELLISPLLNRLKGIPEIPVLLKKKLGVHYKRKKSGTLFLIPARYSDENEVIPLEYHGSAHIHAYRYAQCIIEIPNNCIEITKGTIVNVRPV